jgi:ABC-2 type transport system ATP-binding protein
VRDCVSELRGQGRTIFLCTHNLAEAEELCDRIALFKTRLIRVDTPARLRGMHGRALRVRVGGEAARWLERVRALGGVREASAEGAELRLELDEPERATPALVRALCEAGADIFAVREELESLESVYLELVGRGGEQEGATDGG